MGTTRHTVENSLDWISYLLTVTKADLCVERMPSESEHPLLSHFDFPEAGSDAAHEIEAYSLKQLSEAEYMPSVKPGPDPYTVADDSATPLQVIIHPGQYCTTPQGADVSQAMDLGVRTWGNGPHGLTTTLIGT